MLEVAARIPKKCWNWRPFVFIIDYYRAFFTVCDPERIGEVPEAALAVARDYQRRLPTDERGYNKEAGLLLFVNRREEAQRVLEHAILGKVQLENG